MTRKDYRLIASALKDAREEAKPRKASFFGIDVAAKRIADALEKDNPAFKRAVFLEACGIAS